MLFGGNMREKKIKRTIIDKKLGYRKGKSDENSSRGEQFTLTIPIEFLRDMEIKEDKDFLFATKQARLATFLENDEERRMYRNVIYNAIKWGKRH